MRKLIIGGIVLVIAMVVWVLYLEYDIKRFRETLPKLPENRSALEQQPQAAPASVEYTDREESVNSHEDVHVTGSIVTDETLPAQMETGTDAILEGEPVDTFQETGDTGLSPELEVLFTAYYPLEREWRKVHTTYYQLTFRDIEISNRIIEISSEDLPISVDGPEREALYAELEELSAEQKSLGKEIFALQDEQKLLYQDLSTLLGEYGFSSLREFEDHYGDTYTAWRLSQ